MILLYLEWTPEAGTLDGTRYNVLLLTLDTTRADRLGCYGYEGVNTPFIDGLAQNGVIFDNAYSPAVLTLPAHASIMTGLLPPEHGVRINASALLRPEVDTLAEILREDGYRTGAVIASVVLDSMFGLSQGFEHYDEKLPASQGHDVFFAERKATEMTDAASSWLSKIGDEPWFLWVHYFDPHEPLTPPLSFGERYGPRSYEGEIAYMDAEIGRLLAGIAAKGKGDRTIVILVGDHGEGHDDHGEQSHGVFLYDETARVPLIIAVPGLNRGTRRVESVVSTTDIMPTVLDLLSRSAPSHLTGRSLLPLMLGREDGPRRGAYLESSAPALMFGWSPLAALRSGRWKYIHGPKPELYDLEADPEERINRIEAEPIIARKLRTRLRRMLEEMLPPPIPREATLSPMEEARLRSLGYTGGAGGEVRFALETDPPSILAGGTLGLADPKEKITALKRANNILSAYGAGNLQPVVGLARAYLTEEPESSAVRQILADAFRGLGNHEEAISEYRVILKRAPRDLGAIVKMGQTLSETGDLLGAKAAYRKALSIHPDHTDALLSLGDAHYLEGDLETAERLYRRILKDRPDHWNSNVAMGTIMIERGDRLSAKEFLRRAIATRPDDLDSYLDLAWIQLGDGELSASLETLSTAETRHPDSNRVLFSMGEVFLSMNRLEEAHRTYLRGLHLAQDARGYFGLGIVAARTGNLTQARRLFERALEIDPDYTPATQALRRLDTDGR